MNVVVIGAQWGDEGKGKIVDYLADGAEIVVRYSGGANAGHTIVNGDRTYKLHLVPSGIIYPDTTVILGSGMVIDPEALFRELEELAETGVSWEGRVLISDRAHLVLPGHREEDVNRDAERARPIGTTGRGIGIAYAHKALRDGVRIADLEWDAHLSELAPEDRQFLEIYRDRLTDMAVDLASFMNVGSGARAETQRVLLEGAQGALLDLDIGTYPYVSSGSSAAGGAASGAGIGPRNIDHVLGVFKAYSTRVGNGPFPSEFDSNLNGELENYIRETGREYGVTTGRPRRVGYLDLVALRYACQTNSIDSLALTHLDVYDELDEIRVCVGYETDGDTLDYFPSSIPLLEAARPITRRFPGWKSSIADCRSYDDLPAPAREYVAFIEQYLGVPVSIVSVGYQREQTIVRSSIWNTTGSKEPA
ncbi:MAG: adenylosuccinate synthase [Spirochaeta sp.]|nr:adenylosuccinate synthase [Spirochaeta sp.]